VEAGFWDSPIEQVAMDFVNETRFGHPLGAWPLRVVRPRLLEGSIQQESPYVSEENTLTLTLSINVDVPPGSRIEVQTLRGVTFRGVDMKLAGDTGLSASQALVASSDFETTGSARGFVALETGPGTLQAGAKAKMEIYVTNGAAEQGPSSLCVEVTFESGTHDAILACPFAGLGVPGENYNGVTRGKDPLQIVSPRFSGSIIQTTPLVASSNMLTVTLTANSNLEPASTVTFSGLVGLSNVTEILAGDASEGSHFKKVALDLSQGVLVLEAVGNQPIMGNQPYEIVLHVVNGNFAQSDIKIEIAGDAMVSVTREFQPAVAAFPFAKIELARPGGSAFGISSGEQALRLVAPAFANAGQASWLMQQSNPLRQPFLAELLVTVRFNLNMPADSQLIFEGAGFELLDPFGLVNVSCFKKQAFAPHAEWDAAAHSFTLTLVDVLELGVAYEVVIKVALATTPAPKKNTHPLSARAVVKTHGSHDSRILPTHLDLLIDLGNRKPVFHLIRTQVLALQGEAFEDVVADHIGPAEPGVIHEAEQSVTFYVNVATGQCSGDGVAVSGNWMPAFAANEAPRIDAATGKLTFELKALAMLPLLEHQSCSFPFQVTLKDDGGTAFQGAGCREMSVPGTSRR